jgi:hypothetical protein
MQPGDVPSMFADVSLNMSISNRLWWSSGRAI